MPAVLARGFRASNPEMFLQRLALLCPMGQKNAIYATMLRTFLKSLRLQNILGRVVKGEVICKLLNDTLNRDGCGLIEGFDNDV